MRINISLLVSFFICLGLHAAPAQSTVESLSFSGSADTNQASFLLSGRIKGSGAPEEVEPKLIYSLHEQIKAQAEPLAFSQASEFKARIFQGKLKELVLFMRGDGEVTNVQGDAVRDWSVRVGPQGARFLVIRPVELATNAPPLTNFTMVVNTRQTYQKLPATLSPLSFVPENALFFDGSLQIEINESVDFSITNLSGLSPLRSRPMGASEPKSNQATRFVFSGEGYSLGLELREKDPDLRKVRWENFNLTGELAGRDAAFVLTGTAIVKHPDGGTLVVLSGDAALTGTPTNANVTYEQGHYLLHFSKPGTYPVELKFNAKVTLQDGWNALNFEVVSSSLRPLTLTGLPSDTQFQLTGAAKPQREGAAFDCFFPSAGNLQIRWKEGKTEELGKLFYSAQGTIQATVGAGLLRQSQFFEFKVMQGELNQVAFDIAGEGEVSRVTGENILGWKIEPGAANARRLVVQLNQGRKDRYALLVQTQTPLGVFPLRIQPLRLTPTQVIRYGGHLLVANDGAVRLEVTETRGLSQISPDLFPQVKELAESASPQRSQAFAYRFSGGDFSLTIQADNILPELSVSEMLLYHLGETDLSIEGEIEMDIREAPLREFVLRVPADYTVSRLNVAQLGDYSLTPDTEAGWSKLKILFTAPLTGRQVVQLRLEKNQNATQAAWSLPALAPQNVKSVRGYVGIASETGFRITPGAITGLTEIANAFFPRKIAGLQAAYRLREEAWQASVNIERLALSMQADVTHLFTINEGIAYGSSVINYLISGTPVSVLKVGVPVDYSNLEFTGRDVRNWKKNGESYEVYLQTPVFGAYTLLATYDRQFGAQSNTVSFTGAQPLDVQSEQGDVFVVSEQQLQLKTAAVSPGLLQLDPGEISPEQRLLFDSPILAAYQYTSRPFDLRLTLQSLALGETVHQVIDRASLETQVSREGELVTTARYFLKSQGHSHLRLTLPPDAQLWEAKVGDAKVVPVADKNATLIPLPARADPSAILEVELKLAAKSPSKNHVKIRTPSLEVPVLLTEWKLTPDQKYQLDYKGGSVAPTGESQESGFTWIRDAWSEDWKTVLLGVPALLGLGLLLVRWATNAGTFRWSLRFTTGAVLGLAACLAAGAGLVILAHAAVSDNSCPDSGLSLRAPIQEAGQFLTIEAGNRELGKTQLSILAGWPALFGLGLWTYLFLMMEPGFARRTGVLLGWLLVCWGSLRLPNGAPVFFSVMLAFVVVEILMPVVRALGQVPRRPGETAPPVSGAATALMMLGLFTAATAFAETTDAPPRNVVQSISQEGRVADGFVFVKSTLTWDADAGQHLDFLSGAAVLTQIDYPRQALRLTEDKAGALAVQRLTATQAGHFEIAFQYQTAVPKETGTFVLPTPLALVNRLSLNIEKADVEIFSDNAVSIQSKHSADPEATRATLVLAPVANATVGWRPRARDPRTEKAVFYAELWHLFIPTAGVVEGAHEVQIRPAQGQLEDVSFQIPGALTITDVQAPFVSGWRFDPDQRILRVQFAQPQSKPFSLRVRSQLAAGPLPYQQTNSVISVVQSAGQIGSIGIATGSDVQLDTVRDSGLSAINLEDFPAGLVAELAPQFPGLTLRRAFRYSEPASQVVVSAQAVQPDVRVETQETLSLGEDRTVLASQWTVHITRAGIFKLSFALPSDFEVESLTGAALSHWTELKAGDQRIVTLNLRGKTEGDQVFNVSLTGPGLGRKTQWEAPRLGVREASKQTGQLVLSPELGTRLHVNNPEGVSQLDPKKVGVQQKGVLAFRLLRPDWRLPFDIETVEPWIQVGSLQDVTVREGQALVTVQFDFQVENAGIKSLALQIPARAENVRFEGELISDSVRSAAATNAWADWDLKLQRRVIGAYPLTLTYQLTMTNQSAEMVIQGVKVRNANLQHGYLALRAAGRLQLQTAQLPAALQRTEWQSIPASLRRSRALGESKDTFSTMETDFQLAISLSRHEIAKVLPARVERVDLTSVVAASGEMLTEGRLMIWPGDKRQLRLKLPAEGRFWYAFVNGQSAWPWRDGDQIVLLLEKNSDPTKPATIEFFYTSPTGTAGRNSKQLPGPSFDLPLENITWQVYLAEDETLKHWDSSLQLISDVVAESPATVDLGAYLKTETARLEAKSKDAESMLQMGNNFLQQGTPQQARRAYQSAWKLSSQDAALNEDARVQLHNLKMQQALIGLNQRRQAAFEFLGKGAQKTVKTPFSGWTPGEAPAYTQQQAQQALELNGSEDNAALMKLAERLIGQQDAGTTKPESIRASLPTQGRQLTFKGSLQVDEWAPLKIKLDTRPEMSGRWAGHLAGLVGLLVLLAVLVGLAPKSRKKQN